MGWERDFENWRDEIHCGGRFDRPREYIEAEIGAKYEVVDYVNDFKVVDVVICTEENKRNIEYNLNDRENDMWGYRKVEPPTAWVSCYNVATGELYGKTFPVSGNHDTLYDEVREHMGRYEDIADYGIIGEE